MTATGSEGNELATLAAILREMELMSVRRLVDADTMSRVRGLAVTFGRLLQDQHPEGLPSEAFTAANLRRLTYSPMVRASALERQKLRDAVEVFTRTARLELAPETPASRRAWGQVATLADVVMERRSHEARFAARNISLDDSNRVVAVLERAFGNQWWARRIRGVEVAPALRAERNGEDVRAVRATFTSFARRYRVDGVYEELAYLDPAISSSTTGAEAVGVIEDALAPSEAAPLVARLKTILKQALGPGWEAVDIRSDAQRANIEAGSAILLRDGMATVELVYALLDYRSGVTASASIAAELTWNDVEEALETWVAGDPGRRRSTATRLKSGARQIVREALGDRWLDGPVSDIALNDATQRLAARRQEAPALRCRAAYVRLRRIAAEVLGTSFVDPGPMRWSPEADPTPRAAAADVFRVRDLLECIDDLEAKERWSRQTAGKARRVVIKVVTARFGDASMDRAFTGLELLRLGDSVDLPVSSGTAAEYSRIVRAVTRHLFDAREEQSHPAPSFAYGQGGPPASNRDAGLAR